ncbi:oligomeric mucus gel-forming [Neopestalotiopsis sp. 37M]|nr:oligomeric mucus gel-forming [Neopestalotiopsis sp. 37M]
MATIYIPEIETTLTTTSVSRPDTTTSETPTAADLTVTLSDVTATTPTSLTTSTTPTSTREITPTTTSPTTTSTSSRNGSTTVIVITSTKAVDSTGISLSAASWSPLTTTFIPPSSCFNRYYQVDSSSNVAVISSGTLDPEFNECQFNGSPDLTYSPGMCPGRMMTATRTSSDGHFTELCCQSGFAYDQQECVSNVGGAIFPTSGTTQFLATIASIVAKHEAVTIIWASSDLSLFPYDVASNRSAIVSDANASEGLTQAAKIGIGVGVGLGMIIILIITSAWLLKVRRMRRQLPGQERNGVGELDGEQKIWKRFFGREWRAELPPDGRPSELEAKSGKPTELAVPQIPVELPGSYQYLNPATEDEGTGPPGTRTWKGQR